MPITPHHVMIVIATPIGPKPVHPLSRIGSAILAAMVSTTPSISTPANPATNRDLNPRAPSRTSNTGVSDQNNHSTAIAPTPKVTLARPAWRADGPSPPAPPVAPGGKNQGPPP